MLPQIGEQYALKSKPAAVCYKFLSSWIVIVFFISSFPWNFISAFTIEQKNEDFQYGVNNRIWSVFSTIPLTSETPNSLLVNISIISEQHDKTSIISKHDDILVTSAKICVMEKLSLKWSVASNSIHTENVSIAVVDSTGSKMFLAPLGTSSSIYSDEIIYGESIESRMENDHGIIHCALNAEHCIPKIRSVVSHVNEGRLTITFDQSTNTPKLESTYAIRSALNITPRIIGGAVGEWTSADTLGSI